MKKIQKNQKIKKKEKIIVLPIFWVLKIAGKTYTNIPALLFRLDQGRDILVEPSLEVIS
jgi:hypothetical protein